MTANVTVDESGKVVGLEVSAEDETPTVGGQAVEPMTKAILDAGGIDGVDGVTGATITSTAILNAVKDALTQAGVLDASSGEISYTAGTYTGEANGRAGVVTVNVTVSDKEILSIDVTENPDTAGISDRAVEQIPDSIIQSQSLGVDAVAGATMTSRGIINAVADALGKSGVDLDAPIINELPLTLECELLDVIEGSLYLGEIKNVSMDESILGEDGELDLTKFVPITYDPIHHGYYPLGQRVGNAFADGAKLK